MAGPAEEVRVGEADFQVVKKEVVLRDRLVGSKHWKHTAYGEQAIDMLGAFGDDLDMSWLHPELQRDDAFDALASLRESGCVRRAVTDQVLRDLIEDLNRRS